MIATTTMGLAPDCSGLQGATPAAESTLTLAFTVLLGFVVWAVVAAIVAVPAAVIGLVALATRGEADESSNWGAQISWN